MADLAALFALPGADAPPGLRAERLRLVRPATLPATEWILASRSAHLFRVYHEDYELCVVPPSGNERDAGGDYTYRRLHLDCRPGAVYLLEPDTLHANHRIFAPASFYVLKVSRAVVDDVGRELGLGERPHFRHAATSSPVLAASLARLVRAVVGGNALSQETCLVATLRVAFGESGERRPIEDRTRPATSLARAREYLHARAMEDVSLADLVAVAGLTRAHLVRSFTRTHRPPWMRASSTRPTSPDTSNAPTPSRLLRIGAPAHFRPSSTYVFPRIASPVRA